MGKLAIVFALLALGSAPAHAETWKCSYQGKWRGDGDSGTFAWVLRWTSSGGGWRLVGDFADKYGSSTLDGSCATRSCKLTQHYTAGRLSGKRFYWHGTYTDRSDGPRRTVNTFTGTWGTSPTARANGGSWSASAVCVKQ